MPDGIHMVRQKPADRQVLFLTGGAAWVCPCSVLSPWKHGHTSRNADMEHRKHSLKLWTGRSCAWPPKLSRQKAGRRRMPMRLVAPAVVLAALMALAGSHQAHAEAAELPVEAVIAQLPASHPVDYYTLAARLFGQVQRDDAVFWFYAGHGQLRYRLHLMANPHLPADGDPALFASLSEVVGRPLNEYAAGDIDQLVATLNAVLDWDRDTPNLFTDTARHADEWQRVRAGLAGLRDDFVANADALRAERTARGLENR